jgi:hypothetical protein
MKFTYQILTTIPQAAVDIASEADCVKE